MSRRQIGPGLAELVGGNTAFAFDLYQMLAGAEKGNIFFSPYSISAALAMTYAGARGETERQMAEVLHFGLSQSGLHPAFNVLDLALASRGEGAKGKDGEGFRLNIANAIWGQAGYEFLQPFLDVLDESYTAGLQRVDFQDPETARTLINAWVAEQTEGMITEPIPPGLLDAMVRLILANAVYFNAAWAKPFQEYATEDGPFYLLGGDEVTVSMMRNTDDYGYAVGDGYQVVELPYDGREIAMTIILPDEGNFASFDAKLDAKRVVEVTGGVAYRKVALTWPKGKIRSGFMLGAVLKAMGMPNAFGDSADFSGMAGDRWLKIQEVIHQAVVDWDEAGTEAAAVTVVVMRSKGVSFEQPVKVVVDRPFIFLIRDIETGTILFVGRVMDPTK